MNEAELSPEEFQVRKERMKAMREQVQLQDGLRDLWLGFRHCSHGP